MTEPLPESEEQRLRASFDRQAMLATLGAELVEISHGRAVLEMPSDPRFAQQFGYTHAGAVTTLVDTACGYAALSTMGADREVLTVDFTTNFVAPAAGARFRATATVLRPAGRSWSPGATCTPWTAPAGRSWWRRCRPP